jgi:phage shock protein E
MGFLSKLFGMNNTNTMDIASAIQNGALLLDVRTPAEFRSGSVKGAINVPLDNLTSGFGKISGSDTVVVFCRSGNRSRMAKSILEQLGMKKVFDGGTWENVESIRSQAVK